MRRLFGGRIVARWLLIGVIGLLGGGVGVLSCHPPQLSIEERCERSTAGSAGGLAYERCLLENARKICTSNDSAERDEAERLLKPLLETDLKVDALRYLGALKRKAKEYEEAERYVNRSIEVARDGNDWIGMARGLIVRAQVLWQSGKFTEAFDDAEKAEIALKSLLKQSGEVLTELANSLVSALITKGDVLRHAGVMKQACLPLEEATTIPEAEKCFRARAKVKLAMCEEESQDNGEAKKWLRAARAEGCTQDNIVVTQILLNEALQDLLDGWLKQAEEKIEDSIDREGEDSDTSLLRAYAAIARGQLEEAKRYLEQAEKDPSDADWPWVMELVKADIARQQGDRVLAERSYRRSITEVNKLRGDSRSRSAYLMTSHQAPYDGLITLLASQHRWKEVLEVIHWFDASDMLRAAAKLSTTTAAVAMPTDHLLKALRGKDVIILLVPPERRVWEVSHAYRFWIRLVPFEHVIWKGDHAYRFLIRDGQIHGEDLGPAEELSERIFKLKFEADNHDLAKELGEKLLPQDGSTEPLHVLALGDASQVPLSLLRQADDSLAQKTRPMSNLLALQTSTPPVTAADGPVVIVGSPRGDLSNAARERDEIAEIVPNRMSGRELRLLGAGAPLPATLEELKKVLSPFILHMAMHTRSDKIWPSLELADRLIDAPELLQSGLVPEIAVLASCGSAEEATDDRWGSVASALIEAGTRAVVATRHTIPDASSRVLMKALYQQPEWPADPARALANVQILAASDKLLSADGTPIPASEWSAFLVIERPVYLPPAAASPKDPAAGP